jgi:hypothetical protein
MDGNIITVTYLFVGIRELVPISCKNACRLCLVAILLPVESAQVPSMVWAAWVLQIFVSIADITYRAVIFAVTRISLELGCRFFGGSGLCSSESVTTSSLRASEVAFVADDVAGVRTRWFRNKSCSAISWRWSSYRFDDKPITVNKNVSSTKKLEIKSSYTGAPDLLRQVIKVRKIHEDHWKCSPPHRIESPFACLCRVAEIRMMLTQMLIHWPMNWC